MYGFGLHNRVMPLLDKDGGTGGTTEDATGDQKVAEESADETKDQKDQKGGKGEKEKAEEKLFSQKDLDAHIADRLERERKKNEADAEKARKKAEDDALEKNKEFQQLAETRAKTIGDLEAQIGELTPLKEEVKKYKTALEGYAKAQMKGLPKHVLALLEKLDPVDQLQYMTDHAKELNLKQANPIEETPDDADGTKVTKEKVAEARKRTASFVRGLV